MMHFLLYILGCLILPTFGLSNCTAIKKHLDVDGIDVIPILKKDGKKYFILVEQYRPIICRWILEFPSGYVDVTDKTVEDAGIRELKEETGYTVTRIIRSTKSGQFLNPGVSTDSDAIMLVEVDGADSRNKNPKQHLDSTEIINVVLVETEKLLEYLDNVLKEGKIVVATQVYSFALSNFL